MSGLRDGDMIASTFTDEISEGIKIRPHEDEKAEEKTNAQPKPVKPTPPGGSTQYGDPGIEDQDMQGQNAKPQQKKPAGGASKGSGKSGTQQ